MISGPTFIGGISNAGTISGNAYGIYLDQVTTFSGGISSSGVISATGAAIALSAAYRASQAIFRIRERSAAKTGIAIAGSTINGAIVDSGNILASNYGISIDSASKISSTKTAIAVTGPTFTGGISNSGLISAGPAGISVSRRHDFCRWHHQ